MCKIRRIASSAVVMPALIIIVVFAIFFLAEGCQRQPQPSIEQPGERAALVPEVCAFYVNGREVGSSFTSSVITRTILMNYLPYGIVCRVMAPWKRM
ncbi:MAG TPA: hypothetical protein GX520_11930 [Syntrophaceticus sp.]|nr:hypothetical protein [Syntrophaceticus sp.]